MFRSYDHPQGAYFVPDAVRFRPAVDSRSEPNSAPRDMLPQHQINDNEVNH